MSPCVRRFLSYEPTSLPVLDFVRSNVDARSSYCHIIKDASRRLTVCHDTRGLSFLCTWNLRNGQALALDAP